MFACITIVGPSNSYFTLIANYNCILFVNTFDGIGILLLE